MVLFSFTAALLLLDGSHEEYRGLSWYHHLCQLLSIRNVFKVMLIYYLRCSLIRNRDLVLPESILPMLTTGIITINACSSCYIFYRIIYINVIDTVMSDLARQGEHYQITSSADLNLVLQLFNDHGPGTYACQGHVTSTWTRFESNLAKAQSNKEAIVKATYSTPSEVRAFQRRAFMPVTSSPQPAFSQSSRFAPPYQPTNYASLSLDQLSRRSVVQSTAFGQQPAGFSCT